MNTSTYPTVRVSPRNTRYFELSNGQPYIPIGFNLVGFPEADDVARVLGRMAKNRVNYCRIWLGREPLDVEHTHSGLFDKARAEHVREFLRQARLHGVYVKLCFEFFRDITPEKTNFFDKPLHHANNGGHFQSMRDFLESERGREQFKRKMAWYAERFADDPAVFGWELWNEMDAVNGEWLPWTREMLAEARRLFPHHLVMQSLGSYDDDHKQAMYRTCATLPNNDVAQVHRYLDLGAPATICHDAVDVLAADAVQDLISSEPNRPVLLAETGAVKPKHTGSSELYDADAEGTLLHDMLFAPFFAGAAGSGHVWFWREAIDRPDLWHHFAHFADALNDIDPAAEAFVPLRVPHPRLRVYGLKGRTHSLIWCRDARNDWRSELKEGQPPDQFKDMRLTLSGLTPPGWSGEARIFDPWANQWQTAHAKDDILVLPKFRRSLIVKMRV
jgi:hypothetical protein